VHESRRLLRVLKLVPIEHKSVLQFLLLRQILLFSEVVLEICAQILVEREIEVVELHEVAERLRDSCRLVQALFGHFVDHHIVGLEYFKQIGHAAELGYFCHQNRLLRSICTLSSDPEQRLEPIPRLGFRRIFERISCVLKCLFLCVKLHTIVVNSVNYDKFFFCLQLLILLFGNNIK